MMRTALLVAFVAMTASTCFAASTLTITGCTFRNLHAGQGAALSIKGDVAVNVDSTSFHQLSATTAGAIYVSNEASLTVENSFFVDVTATGNGASIIYINEDDAAATNEFTFTNNVFINTNSAPIFSIPSAATVTATGNYFQDVDSGVANGEASVSVMFNSSTVCTVSSSSCTNTFTATGSEVVVSNASLNLDFCAAVVDTEGDFCPADALYKKCGVPTELGGAGDCVSCSAGFTDVCLTCGGSVTDVALCQDSTPNVPSSGGGDNSGNNQVGDDAEGDDDDDADSSTPIIAAVVAAIVSPIVLLVAMNVFGKKQKAKKSSMANVGGEFEAESIDLEETTGTGTYSLDSAGTMDSLATA